MGLGFLGLSFHSIWMRRYVSFCSGMLVVLAALAKLVYAVVMPIGKCSPPRSVKKPYGNRQDLKHHMAAWGSAAVIDIVVAGIL